MVPHTALPFDKTYEIFQLEIFDSKLSGNFQEMFLRKFLRNPTELVQQTEATVGKKTVSSFRRWSHIAARTRLGGALDHARWAGFKVFCDFFVMSLVG